MPLSTFLDGFSRAILPIIAQLTSRGTGVELAHTIPDASAGHRVVISLTPIAHTDERYLCLCVDLGQIAEPTRFWNPAGAKGSTLETVNRSTYDFGRIRLRNMASALAPGLLRIGGTEADRVFYALDAEALELADTTPPPPFKSVLKAARIDSIGEFAAAIGFEVVFALNAGWAARTAHGAWDSTQARDLLGYIKAKKLPFAAFELGNEPNGWPYLQGGLAITPEQFAVDLFALIALRDEVLPSAKIAAPSTAWFPSIGELPAPKLSSGTGGVSGVSPRWMHGYLAAVLRASERLALPDIVTWHYYPGQSDRAVSLRTYRNAGITAGLTAIALVLGLCFQSRVRKSVEESSAAAFKRPRRVTSFATSTLCLAFLYVVLASFVCMAGLAVFEIVTPVTLHSLRSPSVLDRAKVWGAEVRDTAQSFGRLGGGERGGKGRSRRGEGVVPEVWLGETGSAQAGGQPGVSGRWVATLWWLDQLGALAVLDHKVQCRQTLSGSDYGLIEDETLRPTPEFWASVLWRQLMGTDVYAASAEGSAESVRVYCHGKKGVRSCLFLNLGDRAVAMDLKPVAGKSKSFELWLLEAEALESATLTINGVPPQTDLDGKVPPLPGVVKETSSASRLVTLPPTSAAFVRF